MDRTFAVPDSSLIRHYLVTPASPEDWLSQVVWLESMLFPKPYGRVSLERDLRQEQVWVDVLVQKEMQGEHVVAYGISQKYVDEMHLIQLGTHPEQQRKGYGRFLLHVIEQRAQAQRCERMVLEVRVGQSPAMGLYVSMGFVVQARRKNYYTDNGEDAYLMTKSLSSSFPPVPQDPGS